MRKVQHYIHEIEKALKAEFASDKKAKYKDLKKYIGTQYDFIGLSVPTQRKVFKMVAASRRFRLMNSSKFGMPSGRKVIYSRCCRNAFISSKNMSGKPIQK